MTQNPDIRSYCNPYPPRHSQAAQEARLTGEVYVEDKTGTKIDALIRSVRKGSIVEVTEIGLLAPIKGRPSKRRALLADRVERIKARGGIILELETGSQSNKGQLPRMMVRGSEFIASSGRAGNKKDRAGAPGIQLTPAEREAVAGIWTSRAHKNDTTRLAAIEKRIGRKLKRGWLWAHFGSPSGTT